MQAITTRKVTANIPIKEHTALKLMASNCGTTIEGLVKLGLSLVPAALKDPKHSKSLQPDNRLSRQ